MRSGGLTVVALRVAVAILLATPAFAASEADPVELRAGFQKVLEHPGITRISIGNPEIIEARPLPGGNGVLVVGKKEGETDLVVWFRSGRASRRVRISSPESEEYGEATAFVANFPGLRASASGKTVLVEGTVQTAGDRKLVESWASSRPGVIARIRVPEDGRKLLSYDLKILEISRGASSQIGIRFPDALQASASWGNVPGSVFTVGTQFEARLNMLLAEGKARILANPRIVCESGASADFLAGGEIPIVLVTPRSRTVEWKTYGVILKLSPTLGTDNSIFTKVTVEISTIDHGSGSSEVPAFLTRRLTTSFSTTAGDTVMLSGLVKSETAKDVARVPLLGQIPILGELFKSRSFRDSLTELAVFITPSGTGPGDGVRLGEWEEKSRREAESLRFRLID